MNKALKFVGSLIGCNAYRLIRLFPNGDPIIGCTLPLARKFKWWQAMLFPMIAIISFDFITMRVTALTWGTALTFGFIALLFHTYFKRKKKVGLKTYAKSSAAGVLIFDFVTGPIMSSYVFGMPFSVAFVGQIPFTIAHLASGVAFTLALAPVLDPDVRPAVQEALATVVHTFKSVFSNPFMR